MSAAHEFSRQHLLQTKHGLGCPLFIPPTPSQQHRLKRAHGNVGKQSSTHPSPPHLSGSGSACLGEKMRITDVWRCSKPEAHKQNRKCHPLGKANGSLSWFSPNQPSGRDSESHRDHSIFFISSRTEKHTLFTREQGRGSPLPRMSLNFLSQM